MSDPPALRPDIPEAAVAPMTHCEVLEAMSGLLLALFVATLSWTVVSNALPRIVDNLGGSQSGYTWIVVATLLTTHGVDAGGVHLSARV